VLRILRQLQTGSGLNAAELADQLDVCRRTVFRDLGLLRDAGIAFYFDATTRCYRLAQRDDLLVAPELDVDELTTLIAAVRLSMLQGVPNCRSVLRQTTNKLLAQSPFPVRHGVTLLAGSCFIDTPADCYTPHTTRVLHQVLQALRQRKWLHLHLSGSHPEAPLQTRLAIYQLLVDARAWHVTGRSSYHRDVRTFDVRDIAQAELGDEAYAIPRIYRTA
jgi:predicted DNA-binding transcriptional regulator YafY